MSIQYYIILFNLLFLETMTYNLSVTQLMPKITEINQTISQFNSTYKFNTTLQIQGENFYFLIVEIQLTSNVKSSVALLYNEHIPTSLINKTIQFKDMDYDSYALKRLNHYLIIPNFPHSKFITILSDTSITFNFTLQGTNESKCFNNCSKNGKCFQGRCFCKSDYIGKDCSIKATELKIQSWSNHTLSNYVTFFYYNQQEKSKELDLIFYTNSQQNLTILEIVSSFIHIPTLKYYDFLGKFNKSNPLSQIISSKGFQDLDDDDFLEEDTDDDNSDINNGFLIMNNLPAKLIIAVICQFPNEQLSILFQKRQTQRDKLDYLNWLIAVSIIGFLFIVLGAIWLKFTCDKQKNFENQYSKVQTTTNDEICAICQTNLKIEKNTIYKSKVCQNNHLFHKKCIINFFDKNQKLMLCPTCPQIIINLMEAPNN
ncbi:unnamed protein product [Paramecium sonneborni]|uniref:RING-type domain-containing protein n=1 Tax=Paramecium sonneborni TaxID=65129 RepID=A0A8S1RE56_9CILI|nr:unnamed protein product [Paramecium sonneborni]